MKFQTIRIEGNTISADILEKISEGEYKGQQPKDFGFEPGTKVKDEIARAWADAQNQWKIFKSRTSDLDDDDTGLPEVRKYWMIPFLGLLDYNLEPAQAEKLENGNTYPISHREAKLDRFPAYIVGFKDKAQKAPEERSTLDIKPSNATRKMSPHALVQEYVNLTEYAYAIITNGLQIRLLRDSSRLVKLSFLEFDLERMMEEEAFADFALLFRVLHASRLPKTRQETNESFIEQYHQDSIESGARIREGLSEAVEKSIRIFANGFLKHPDNQALRDAVSKKEVTPDKYYQQQLRLIYRLLFLMVTEERNLIYPDLHNRKLRDIYYKYYSVERLRKMVDKRFLADAHYSDHWEGLKHTFQLFERERYGGSLDIKPLNGELFGINALGLLNDCALDNQVMLECMRNLTVFVNKNSHQITRVNYASLNVEEFGSVYEGLLEYDPVLHITDEKTISFDFKTGEGRSSSGSHYTPEELVQPLIKHSLEYIIEDKLKEKNKEAALLSIKVCDVACGSGHILLSAARRIATEVARVRTGEDQPTPGTMRVATRDVIKNCIYGVDKNPLAVELCKVALWLESHNPGEPLGFLDHHIKCGDAIVGLAHREELEKGIADEAFKTLPGDEKEVASAMLKKNREERKEREVKSLQLKTEFDNTVQGNVQEAMEEYGNFEKLPERTPDEVEAKQQAYHRFLNGRGVTFLKTMADTQVAQFFIPKTQSNKERLITDSEFRQILTGHKAWQSTKTSYSIVPAQEQRFFHWFLEFPEVFQQGGFDCILGNPPFLGGKKISGNFGDDYLNCLKSSFINTDGNLDFVAYFFRRTFEVLNANAFVSLISTNSIFQGDTRHGSLEQIINSGGKINHAVRNIRWPGKAAVTVSLITISKSNNNTLKKYLDGKIVQEISSYLDDSDSQEHPYLLSKASNSAFVGSVILGTGFLLEKEEGLDLLKSDAKNQDVVFDFLSGDDLNNDPEQKASRMIINFFDWPLSKSNDQSSNPDSKHYADQYQICLDRIRLLVKPERDKLSDKGYKEKWWQYGRKGIDLYNSIRNSRMTLVLTRVSKHLNVALVPSAQVFMDKVVVIASEKFKTLAILQSTIHDCWAWKHSSTLGGSTLTYRPSEAFQTFPFPSKTKIIQSDLDKIGEAYNLHRSSIMRTLNLGLTKIYNSFHSQYLTSVDIEKHSKQPREVCEKAQQDILKLRELHVQMDQAVLEAYGWQDIQLSHNFYEVDYLPENDRVRYTIHPKARKEILKRLLELNHRIHEEEVKAGLWDKKKPEKAKSKQESKVLVAQELLFPDNYNSMLEFKYDEGIYSISDVTEMIKNGVRLPDINKSKVTRWFKDLAEENYEGLKGDNKKDIDNLRIGFYGLVELVVIAKLRDCGISLKTILTAREDLGRQTKKKIYPFATNDVSKILKVDGRKLFHQISKDEILSLNKTDQYNLKFIVQFFESIDFRDGLAIRFTPPISNGKVIIDPQVGDGKPVIKGKEIPVQTIWQIYNSNKNINKIKSDYGLTEVEINAALAYFNE